MIYDQLMNAYLNVMQLDIVELRMINKFNKKPDSQKNLHCVFFSC